RGLRTLLDEMLSVEATQRPTDMSQIKKRLEFILNRPVVTSIVGAVYGVILGIALLLPPFTPFGQPLPIWMVLVPLIVATPIEPFIQKKLKIPKKISKGFMRFRLLGVLLGMLPFLLWHLFFAWPF
ncbi:MAG TPA: hypothetical protein VGM01_00015, partial [Ktedonobacteraceae bacterium]